MKDGIYTDIDITAYHSNRTHISATSIKEAKVSMRQFKWHREGKMPPKTGMHFDTGNAFELALLDKVGFEKDVAILQTEYWIQKALEEKPGLKVPKNSKTYKEYEAEFYKTNTKKYVIADTGQHSFQYIEQMLESCFSDPTINKLISGIDYQTSLFWTDKETGLKLKTRPDICKVKKNVVVNVKTATDASPRAFSRELAKFDYPLQACIEITGCVETGLMKQVDNYFWLVVEKEPPFNAVIYEFDKADISVCMDEFYYLKRRISECMEIDEWPGYTDRSDNKHGILQAFIPPYYKEF